MRYTKKVQMERISKMFENHLENHYILNIFFISFESDAIAIFKNA